jgi:PelA/Pel-15E family pectate lyase
MKPRRLLVALCGALAGLWPVLGPAQVAWNQISRQSAEWYAGDEARAIATSVVAYQTGHGGWPKNTDMTKPPPAEFLASQKLEQPAATIDNGATTTQVRYLAQVLTARDDPALRAAFERGFDYLLAAQYPNGGWPQYFPLREGYYTHITYNDNAMVSVLAILRETARGQAPFAFVDEARRAKAVAAVAKGIGCILRTQVKQAGRLTAWCAQHDETTFAPAPARNFEPVSLSGSESVGLTRFLMGVEEPTPEIIAAVEGAVAWFQAVAIKGLRVETFTGTDGKRDRRAVADPAAPPLWARFYELGTNRAIFIGRDKVIRHDLNEIEQERRVGYSYLSDWPASLLAKDYPRWRAKHKLP